MPSTYRKDGDYYVSACNRLMSKPGRRSRLTVGMRERILADLRLGVERKTCLRRMEVSRQTFIRWLQADETFREDVVRAERHAANFAELLEILG